MYYTCIFYNTIMGALNALTADNGVEVKYINDLQWIQGLIYANIWRTDCIAQIDPSSGSIVGWALMQGLKAKADAAAPAGYVPSPEDVFNGMAYDPNDSGRLFVTGKRWARLFQVELSPLNPNDPPSGGAPLTLDAARQACIPLSR